MSVKIRLRRTGKRNQACHRIVVADSRSPRDGRFIEVIGFYDPRHENEKIDLERVDYWLPRGAQVSDTVNAIIKRAREGKSLGGATAAAATAETQA
ncbi:MAG: 30S ribosomal protein S16 [Lentisphaerae bacterium]|jgi:small subunit ribosomal protein S16|nr:30S ribosomal protein S16 [Lentisphaerota bacterium]